MSVDYGKSAKLRYATRRACCLLT